VLVYLRQTASTLTYSAQCIHSSVCDCGCPLSLLELTQSLWCGAMLCRCSCTRFASLECQVSLGLHSICSGLRLNQGYVDSPPLHIQLIVLAMLARAGAQILKAASLNCAVEKPNKSTSSIIPVGPMLEESSVTSRSVHRIPTRLQTCESTMSSFHGEAAWQETFSSCSSADASLRCKDTASCQSVASSGRLFCESSQTLIFLDWDDTLFPTTHLSVTQAADVHDLPETEQVVLKDLEDVLKQFLSIACSQSNRCAIVTNSSRPWVSQCIARFLPGLKSYMQAKISSGEIVILYAGEFLAKKSRQHSNLRPVRASVDTSEEENERLTAAKYHAMKQEAESFYSSYPGQTWKNILSLGDMKYEHDAVQELTWRRKGPAREHVRTKAIILPEQPRFCELTFMLQLFQIILPAFVHFDGDIDTKLKEARDPWQELGTCLQIPDLQGLTKVSSQVEKAEALDQVAILVHEKLF